MQQKQVDLQQKPFADQKNKYDKKGINFQEYFKKKRICEVKGQGNYERENKKNSIRVSPDHIGNDRDLSSVDGTRCQSAGRDRSHK